MGLLADIHGSGWGRSTVRYDLTRRFGVHCAYQYSRYIYKWAGRVCVNEYLFEPPYIYGTISRVMDNGKARFLTDQVFYSWIGKRISSPGWSMVSQSGLSRSLTLLSTERLTTRQLLLVFSSASGLQVDTIISSCQTFPALTEAL